MRRMALQTVGGMTELHAWDPIQNSSYVVWRDLISMLSVRPGSTGRTVVEFDDQTSFEITDSLQDVLLARAARTAA